MYGVFEVCFSSEGYCRADWNTSESSPVSGVRLRMWLNLKQYKDLILKLNTKNQMYKFYICTCIVYTF